MRPLTPCKYLDYLSDHGSDIELKRLPDPYEHVLYWKRGKRWTDNGPNDPPNPENVQYCGNGRGRINAIFDCYDGSVSCYVIDDEA